jgi:hypothetical protein
MSKQTNLGYPFSDYADALHLYRVYIEEGTDGCPTYDSPLDEETKVLIPELLDLNSHGVLTIDSQPGMVDSEKWQRSYVEFYVKENVWNRLASFLMFSELFYVSCPVSKPFSCESSSRWLKI